MKDLVTLKQACALRALGFNKPVSHYFWEDAKITFKSNPCNWNNSPTNFLCISVPTVDEAIDWIRYKFNIVIYNAHEPFVDPRTNSYIMYTFKAKLCNTKLGWNGRQYIGRGRQSKNIYAAKRDAISLVIRYLNKNIQHHGIRRNRNHVGGICRL